MKQPKLSDLKIDMEGTRRMHAEMANFELVRPSVIYQKSFLEAVEELIKNRVLDSNQRMVDPTGLEPATP